MRSVNLAIHIYRVHRINLSHKRTTNKSSNNNIYERSDEREFQPVERLILIEEVQEMAVQRDVFGFYKQYAD